MITRRNLNAQPTTKVQGGYKYAVRAMRTFLALRSPYLFAIAGLLLVFVEVRHARGRRLNREILFDTPYQPMRGESGPHFNLLNSFTGEAASPLLATVRTADVLMSRK
jgi:hypothetical protein